MEESEQKTLESVINGMQEKKAKDIVCMDLREIPHAICDYFVVCHGDSVTQVEAIARSIEEESLKLSGEKPWHKEGTENAQWILLDFVDVVAHVFHRDARDFYGIEDLWADARVEHIEYQV